MSKKNLLKAKILDFKLASQKEISLELGRRLKVHRILKKIKQGDLAKMAGVSVGTIKNLESKGQTSLESLLKIVRALDLIQDFSNLFELKIRSISQMEKIDHLMNPAKFYFLNTALRPLNKGLNFLP